MTSQASAVPASVTESVLQSSQPVPEGSHEVSGVDFDKFQGRDITVAEMVDNLAYTGFQGSAVAEAARIINEMVSLEFESKSSILESYDLSFLARFP
jgi:deoxyhypusine synthase